MTGGFQQTSRSRLSSAKAIAVKGIGISEGSVLSDSFIMQHDTISFLRSTDTRVQFVTNRFIGEGRYIYLVLSHCMCIAIAISACNIKGLIDRIIDRVITRQGILDFPSYSLELHSRQILVDCLPERTGGCFPSLW